MQWQGETQEFCPNAKVVLVGCKLDMRTDVGTLRELSKQRLIPVTHEQVSSRETRRQEGKRFGWWRVQRGERRRTLGSRREEGKTEGESCLKADSVLISYDSTHLGSTLL